MKHLDRDSIQLLRGLVGPIVASIYKGGGTHVQGLVYRGAGCICFLGSGRLPLSLLFCGKVKRREGREVVSSGHRLVSRQRKELFISRGKWHHCASWASAAIRERSCSTATGRWCRKGLGSIWSSQPHQSG
ncbi:unnamed protein product [Musa acuminata var. zebrina]